ncbi:MAG: hypothetical protein ACLGXA_15065 [Acidobacteriota bacterium]
MPRLSQWWLPALAATSLCAGCGTHFVPESSTGNWIASFTLVDQSANVNAAQGYASGTSATDAPLNFFFSNQVLYRSSSYDAPSPIVTNTNLLPAGTTHLGDGDYYDGHVYGVIEHWHGCKAGGAPIFISIFDGTTLEQEQTIEITPWIPEASGIAIDPDTGQAFVSSFCDAKNLYRFRLSDWSFIGTLPLTIPVSSMQGVAWRDGFLYLAGTDGALYGLYLEDGSMRLLMQSPLSGEFEGLDFHGSELRWLLNRSDVNHILYSYAPVYATSSATP